MSLRYKFSPFLVRKGVRGMAGAVFQHPARGAPSAIMTCWFAMTRASDIVRGLVLVTFLALAYSLLGPVLDPHFPERLPFHSHLFLNSVPAAHTHPAYQPHVQDKGAGDGHSGILFTVDSDGFNSADSLSVWQLFLLSAILALPPTLFAFVAGVTPVRRVLSPILCPSPPPPRAPAFILPQ